MIEPKEFFEAMTARGVGFYTGVPDSLLANFCTYVDDVVGLDKHLITANEGNAVALAVGYHIATGKVAMVYMQNSGLGNTVNPLTSLADPKVYKVPILLVIGWRGEPGIKDEPQHVKQGQITLDQLTLLGIPYWVLDSKSDVSTSLDAAFSSMRQLNAPVALVIRKDTFAKYKSKKPRPETAILAREDALKQLLELVSEDDLVVSTTGKTSRELYELRVKNKQKQRDFLTVGGMGHTASIALGVSIGQPQRRVVCLDGDGSVLMHMGGMPVIAQFRPRNFVHVLLNNGSHESVGGQETAAKVVDFGRFATAVGYRAYAVATDIDSLRTSWQSLIEKSGPVLLEVKIKSGSRIDLGRPLSTAEQNKLAFMEAVGV